PPGQQLVLDLVVNLRIPFDTGPRRAARHPVGATVPERRDGLEMVHEAGQVLQVPPVGIQLVGRTVDDGAFLDLDSLPPVDARDGADGAIVVATGSVAAKRAIDGAASADGAGDQAGSGRYEKTPHPPPVQAVPDHGQAGHTGQDPLGAPDIDVRRPVPAARAAISDRFTETRAHDPLD